MMVDRLPDFLIIGAMRSGTTTLARLLQTHPQVFVPPAKEIHYFDQNFDKPLEWYREWFRDADGAAAAGEASATYMAEPAAPARMAGVVPEARLMAILRHPVDRAYSHYWHERKLGREHLGFREALAAERERTATEEVRPRLRFAYLERSRYLPQLRRVCEHYPREAIHLLILEEFERDPEVHFRSVCRFLGVDDSFVPPETGRAFNRYAEPRSPTVMRAARRIPWRPLRRAVDRLNVRRFGYPPMEPALRRELAGRFEEDNRALAEWLGRDLSVWDE
jgi:hypothetical protein